jgi:prepilin peptidase CpaA
MQMQSVLAECVLGGVVVAGATADLQTGRIPNWLTLPAMAAGLVINGVIGLGVGRALLGMLGALGVYFLFFAAGFRGAGDGKLMGAVGAFVGWPQIVAVLAVVTLLGGAAGLALAWQRGVLFQVARNTLALACDMLRLRWRGAPDPSGARASACLRMPHGPVIAAGTLAFLLFAPR